MYQMMNRSENMKAAACSEAAFSCSANIALTMDAMIMASIIISGLLSLSILHISLAVLVLALLVRRIPHMPELRKRAQLL